MGIFTVLILYLLYRACKRIAQAHREGDPYHWIRQIEGGESYAIPPTLKSQFDERYRFLVPPEITQIAENMERYRDH